jgi:hypothetical protein
MSEHDNGWEFAKKMRDALEKIEKIISDRERALILPDVKDIKKIWNTARAALEAFGSAQAEQDQTDRLIKEAFAAGFEAFPGPTGCWDREKIKLQARAEAAKYASSIPSTQEKPLSICSRCGCLRDPDCYICGTVVSSTEGK